MKLSNYIQKHHGGNQAAFARSQGITKQVVWRMLNKGYWHVYDGMLMVCKAKIKEQAK